MLFVSQFTLPGGSRRSGQEVRQELWLAHLAAVLRHQLLDLHSSPHEGRLVTATESIKVDEETEF